MIYVGFFKYEEFFWDIEYEFLRFVGLLFFFCNFEMIKIKFWLCFYCLFFLFFKSLIMKNYIGIVFLVYVIIFCNDVIYVRVFVKILN